MPSSAQLKSDALAYAKTVDPDLLSGPQAVAVVQDLSIAEKAIAAARMLAALKVAKTDGWRGQGHRSAADWLAAQCGITVREAGAQLGTAKKARKLPKTEEKMRQGDLSPTQAGAVTDGASADPGAEDELLDSAAKDTTAALKEKAAKAKAAATDGPTREKRVHTERSLRTRTDAEGAFCLSLRGPAADGVRLKALLKPHEEQAFRDGRTDGIRDTYDNRSYDAFQNLITHLLHGGQHPASDTPAPPPDPTTTCATDQAAGDDHVRRCDAPARAEGDPPPDRDQAGPTGVEPPIPDAQAGQPPPRQPATASEPAKPNKPPGGNNVKVIVRIDHTALMRGWTVAGETGDVAGLGPVSVAAVREIIEGQDPFLAAVVTKGRDVVNVAHLGRGLSAHQRTAVESQGLRCSNIACNKTIALQIDHRYPWNKKQETKLDNADPLCGSDHYLKTHQGWELEPGTGPRRFLPPDDPDHPNKTAGRASPDAPDVTSVPDRQGQLL